VTPGRVVVAGASGLIGAACVTAFARSSWDVVALSRRPPHVPDDVEFTHIAVDLQDASACSDALEPLKGVARVVYTASIERADLVGGWSDPAQMQTNLRMLQNVLEPLMRTGALEQVTLLQGTKAYGVHLHPIPIPARERQPRDPHENFYWLQEDYVRGLHEQGRLTWTILRPVHVVGPAFGVAYSTPPVIGAFAAICRETGRPFGFPGGDHRTVKQVVDVRIVADAAVWAAERTACWGEHFNLTNGEAFTWRDLWPALGEMVGATVSDIEPISMAEFLPRHAATWERIRERDGLAPLPLAALLGTSHAYADYTFGLGQVDPAPAIVSTVKARQAGFCASMETEQSFRDAFASLQQRSVLPAV
jgi:nucleoside-diphosphate-sugar epimerase